jgi:hypothetical protein
MVPESDGEYERVTESYGESGNGRESCAELWRVRESEAQCRWRVRESDRGSYGDGRSTMLTSMCRKKTTTFCEGSARGKGGRRTRL